MRSAPAAPDLDRLFASDDEPESQDGAVLSAGKVLSQPVDRPSYDPSSDFEDDDDDEETRVLDARELGFTRESRRVDPSLKSALRSSVVPPPPSTLNSRPTTMNTSSRLSVPPPMSVPSVRAPSAMPPPPGPPSAFPPGSRRPPLPPAAPAPSGAPAPLSAPPPLTSGSVSSAVPAPPAAKSRVPLYALLAAALAAVATWFFLSAKGDLLITVAGADNAQLSELRIYVGGTERCTQSPCKVEGLKAGSYTVRAEAPGHVSSAAQAVSVESGSSTAHHIQLKAERTQPQLTVNAQGAGLRVLVGGKDRGAPPLELSDLPAGKHTIRIEGPGYEPLEQTVTIAEGVAQVIGPLSPKLLKGSLRLALNADAEGAQVLVNGKSMRSLPVTLELDAEEAHKVLVRKAGYEDFEQTVTFSPAQPRVDLTISLTKANAGDEAAGASAAAARPAYVAGGSGAGASKAAAPTPAAEEAKAAPPADDKPAFLDAIRDDQKASSKTADTKPADKPAETKASSGKATLNINSVPPTTVLLNGRPLGKTPKAGVSVPAGNHTITFIHSDKGRKNVKVTVGGGESKTVSVRL